MKQRHEVLQVDSLRKSFGKHTAVSALSFDVESGEAVGLLGPNGSGKTTALHMIVGLLDVSSGSIRIDGRSPADLETRRRVGIVPDDLPLPTALTGSEFLELHEHLRGFVDGQLRDELIDLFSLTPHLQRPIGEYSHGMKRKIQIVAGTSHRPNLLILDEPHRGLDPESSIILRELIASLRSDGTAVLVATHDLSQAGRAVDRVAVLNEGSLLAFDTCAAICHLTNSPDLETAFLRLTGLDQAMDEARLRLAAITKSSEFDPESRANSINIEDQYKVSP